MNVLVVDDSRVMRGMIIKTLRASGLPLGLILEAGNGSEALNVLGGACLDLCLVDVVMPVMNGEDFITKLRGEGSTRCLPVVVVSSDLPSGRAARLADRHTAIMHKPFSPERLRDTVVALMGMPELGVLETQLRQMAAEAMEQFCFTLPVDKPTLDSPLVRAMQVRFNGRYSGRLVVAVDEGLYGTIASNMLGESAVHEKLCADALGELANVLCGNLLPLLGWEGEFKMEAPEASSPDCGVGADDCGRYFEFVMGFEEGNLEVALCRERVRAASPV